MRVGLADLPAQYAALKSELDAAVQRVLASGQFILGDEVSAFEREVAADHQLAHAVGVSSGSDALLAALWALGIGPGDEVITPAFSFFATAGAIVRLGATPVFADIDPATFNLDAASALAKVTSRTKAILPVHLFGRPCELPSTTLPIVEDAAQAYGTRLGSLATLSFFPTKNLGAAGDAGMVLVADPALADKIRLIRSHGAKPKYVHHVVGANLRLDALQAAILRVKRPHVASWTAMRRANAERYRELLAGTPLVLPADTANHVWHHFVVRAPDRDALRVHLAARDIETEVYYPRALHLQPCFGGEGSGPGPDKTTSLPEAERACCEVLALPIHAQLDEDQLQHVGDSIRAFY